MDAVRIDYDEHNPFTICGYSFKPIYKGKPCVRYSTVNPNLVEFYWDLLLIDFLVLLGALPILPNDVPAGAQGQKVQHLFGCRDWQRRYWSPSQSIAVPMSFDSPSTSPHIYYRIENGSYRFFFLVSPCVLCFFLVCLFGCGVTRAHPKAAFRQPLLNRQAFE